MSYIGAPEARAIRTIMKTEQALETVISFSSHGTEVNLFECIEFLSCIFDWCLEEMLCVFVDKITHRIIFLIS